MKKEERTKKEMKTELTAKERSKIASKAQAIAHRVLREKYPRLYSTEYQKAKEELMSGMTKSRGDR